MDDRHLGGHRVPTLTEVVELGSYAAAPDRQRLADDPLAPQPLPERLAPSPLPSEADALVAQVLRQLLPHIDHVLELRLQEALAPALAQAADGLIRDTRLELTRTLRELVEEAVARALDLHQGR